MDVTICVLSRIANGTTYNIGVYQNLDVAVLAAQQIIELMGGKWLKSAAEPPRWIHPQHGVLILENFPVQEHADLRRTTHE